MKTEKETVKAAQLQAILTRKQQSGAKADGKKQELRKTGMHYHQKTCDNKQCEIRNVRKKYNIQQTNSSKRVDIKYI